MPKIKINKRVVTPYQEIIDANITLFGKNKEGVFSTTSRCVLINREYQFCTVWYYEYHFFEYLVPTLFFSSDRKLNVLVIGGGDLIGASMLLKYANINKIDLIDIDKQMVNLAENDFQDFHFEKNPLKDKRLHVHIADAFVFVNKLIKKGEKYDIIIYDLPVVDNHKLLPLLSVEFFKKLRQVIKDDGILSIYEEINGEMQKEALLVGCGGFKKLLFMEGFKIKPSEYFTYNDDFYYFTNTNDFKIKQPKLLRKMLLNDENEFLFYQRGVKYDLKCPKNIELNSIFKPDFSIIKENKFNY